MGVHASSAPLKEHYTPRQTKEPGRTSTMPFQITNHLFFNLQKNTIMTSPYQLYPQPPINNNKNNQLKSAGKSTTSAAPPKKKLTDNKQTNQPTNKETNQPTNKETNKERGWKKIEIFLGHLSILTSCAINAMGNKGAKSSASHGRSSPGCNGGGKGTGKSASGWKWYMSVVHDITYIYICKIYKFIVILFFKEILGISSNQIIPKSQSRLHITTYSTPLISLQPWPMI